MYNCTEKTLCVRKFPIRKNENERQISKVVCLSLHEKLVCYVVVIADMFGLDYFDGMVRWFFSLFVEV